MAGTWPPLLAPCRRAVTIAVGGPEGRGRGGGLLSEEATEALRIHAEGGSTYRARLPWEMEPTTYPRPSPWTVRSRCSGAARRRIARRWLPSHQEQSHVPDRHDHRLPDRPHGP